MPVQNKKQSLYLTDKEIICQASPCFNGYIFSEITDVKKVLIRINPDSISTNCKTWINKA